MTVDLFAIGDLKHDIFIPLPEEGCTATRASWGFRPGEKYQTDEMVETLGGTAPNVARALARCGWKTGLWGRVGSDAFSRTHQTKIVQEGVSNRWLTEDLPHLPKSIVLYGYDDRLMFTESNEERHARPHLIIPTSLPEAPYVLLSEDHRPPEALMKFAATYREEVGAKIIWNPGGHQWHARETAIQTFLREVDLLFVNREEAARLLFPSSPHPNETVPVIIRRLHQAGISRVYLTDGGEGAWGSDGSDLVFCPAAKDVKTIDTTGAGDAFLSGALFAHGAQLSLAEEVAYGIALSASVIQYVGPTEGLLDAEVLEQEGQRRLSTISL